MGSAPYSAAAADALRKRYGDVLEEIHNERLRWGPLRSPSMTVMIRRHADKNAHSKTLKNEAERTGFEPVVQL